MAGDGLELSSFWPSDFTKAKTLSACGRGRLKLRLMFGCIFHGLLGEIDMMLTQLFFVKLNIN